MRKLVITGVGLFLLAAFAYRVSIAEEELFDTKSAIVHLEKGISHLKSKNYKAAVDELEEAVSIAPDAENYYYLGYAYYLKGRAGDVESRKKSIECFDKTYELDPRFTPNRYKPAEEVPGHQQKESSEHASISTPSSQPTATGEATTSRTDSPEQQQKQQQ